jgi:hypothetical protein
MKKSTEQVAKELLEKCGVTLESEYLGAKAKVTFSCSNGHKNEAIVTNLLTRGYVCKSCTHGRDIVNKVDWTPDTLLKLTEQLYQGNTLEDIAKGFNTTIAAVRQVIAKHDIYNPRHYRSIPKLQQILADQGRTLLTAIDDIVDIRNNVSIQCTKGHIVSQAASNILQHKYNCPQCYIRATNSETSKPELELLEFIKQHYKGWIETNDRSVLQGKELDIVLPDLGLAIEFNGTYWHSEEKVGKTYHQDKCNLVEAFGFQLIQIRD